VTRRWAVSWRRCRVAGAFVLLGLGTTVAAYYIRADQRGLHAAVARVFRLEQHQASEARDRAKLIAELRVTVSRLETVRAAVCSQRSIEKRQVTAEASQLRQTREFLRAHPKGLPSLGFTAAEIRQGIREQARRVTAAGRDLEALNSVQCVDAPSEGATRSPH
jgi:hypothetical protein